MTADPGSTPYVPGSTPDNWSLIGGGRWEYRFDSLVGLLKAAAIDAYVCSIPLSHKDHYRPVGRHYEAENPRWTWIARPEVDGSGGGYDIPNPNASWQDGMDDVPPVCAPPGDSRDVAREVSECVRMARIDEIRTEIDKIVDPWRDLPDPQDIAAVVDSWRTIYLHLCDRKERPDTGPGSLRVNLGFIQDTLDGRGYLGEKQEGSMIETFTSYMKNLRGAVDCCQDTALILGVALAGAQGIWDCARQDFDTILSSVTIALRECAEAGGHGGGFRISQAFTIGGIVVSAIGLFTGPIGAGVATGTSIGLTLAGEASSSSENVEETKTAPDYSGLLQKLGELLGNDTGLSGRIKTEEQYIKGNLKANLEVLESEEGRKALDPRAEPITSVTGKIRADPALTDYIIETLMPTVSDELDRVAQLVQNSAREVHDGSVDILKRDSRVGDAPTGPTDAFLDLAYRLKSALGELHLEVFYGARNLRAAADALEQSNDAAEAALASSALMASEGVVSFFSSRPFSL